MKRLWTVILLLLMYSADAQVPEPQMAWLKVYEGVCEVNSNVSPQLDGGFILSIGASLNLGNIDSLCGLTNDRVIFVKYNSDASVREWTKCYAGNFNDSAFIYMFLASDSSRILIGIGNGETHNFLIHKENSTGAVLWSKTYGDSAEAILESTATSDDGGYWMLGETNYTNTDFPVHYGGFMNADFAIIKVDSSGDKVWSKVIGGTGVQIASSVVSAPTGGCYLVGTTTSNDYDCTGNHGNSDLYLARLDKFGAILWHHDLGGSGFDAGRGTYACADGKGGVIIVTSSGSADGDVSHQVDVGGHSIWLLQVDSNNNILWDKCYGGGGYEFPNSVCRAVDGSIWITGVANNKGGEVDTAYGNEDVWILHTDNVGNLLSAKVLGSHKNDEGTVVYPLSNNNVLVAGYYDTTGCSFPFISWGGGGSFISVFTPQTTGIAPLQHAKGDLKVYPNPATKHLTIEAAKKGNYWVEISDLTGRVIYRSALNDRLQIQINGWSKGMYFVQVIEENGYEEVQRIMVQ